MRNNKEHLKNKHGGCLKPVSIIIAVCIVIIIAVSAIGGNDDNGTTYKVPEEEKAEQDSSENQALTEAPDPNTSAMVDYIASSAKKSANQSATEEKRNEAIEYIYSHYPDYYLDNKTMEDTMYYGYYLEYAYAKNGENNLYANLGMDAYQAVKDVYRNVEAKDSDHAKSNIKQIADGLSEIGYDVE